MIRLLLVDDQDIVRRGMRMLFELESDIDIVGEAANGRQAIELATALDPTAIIMDVEMPVINGLQATQHIKAQYPNIRIVMLSIHGDEDTYAFAMQAGADAFVEKRGDFGPVLTAVRSVMQKDRKTRLSR